MIVVVAFKRFVFKDWHTLLGDIFKKLKQFVLMFHVIDQFPILCLSPSQECGNWKENIESNI